MTRVRSRCRWRWRATRKCALRNPKSLTLNTNSMMRADSSKNLTETVASSTQLRRFRESDPKNSVAFACCDPRCPRPRTVDAFRMLVPAQHLPNTETVLALRGRPRAPHQGRLNLWLCLVLHAQGLTLPLPSSLPSPLFESRVRATNAWCTRSRCRVPKLR